ncbi:MAG: hypothetical protein SGI86_03930 [Deltaproteobacteria bacterium]|nr:hypothetical protein [Deltaproteobacteria bacterium]
MSEPELNEDFHDFLVALIEAHVRFVVVGAHALAAHGIPRATGDLDILVEPTVANAHAVVEALLRFGAPVLAHSVTEDDFAKPGTVYQMGLPPRRIDILTSISGLGFESVWQGRLMTEVKGLSLAFIGRVELIENKRASARPKDLVDVAALESRTLPPPR